jgi:general secretion pathway protein C
MKRWPILVSFVLFVGLCASATFWSMQLFKPAVRPVAFPKPSIRTEANPETALGLFGGRAAPAAVASNFQLRGVVVSRNPLESVAILVADSKPAEAVRMNSEVMPGVTVKEIHPLFVLLSDGGVMKRVELPDAASQSRAESPVGLVQPQPAAGPAAAPNFVPPPPPSPPGSPAPTPMPQNPTAQGEEISPQNNPAARFGHPGMHKTH